jgi:membrane protease YdiL (CAAX protease family)
MPLSIDEHYQARDSGEVARALLQFVILVCVSFFCLTSFIKFAATLLPASWLKPAWAYGYVTHSAMLLVALAIITILKPHFRGDFGLHWPKGKSYLWPALWIGGLGGLLMLVVDHYPQVLTRHAPIGPYSTAPGNMIPWLIMQGTLVGISEEIAFRSLFLGYLITRLGRKIRLFSFDVSIAGVVIAVAFSLAHASSFWHESFAAAFGQQIYAIGYGLLGAWLLEKSGSVLAPIVAHDAGDLVEWGLRFALTAAWQ